MVSEKVKAILNLTGNKQADLAQCLGINTQSVANKMARDSWTASDLMKVAGLVGAKLVITLPDGQQIVFTNDVDKQDP